MSIALENVCFTYSPGTPFEAVALSNVSFTVDVGQFVGIMGHTGCGKSTLIQLIARLLSPTSGRVLIDGIDINSKEYSSEGLRKKVGIVFQYPEHQLFESTVERDVAFGLRKSGFSHEKKEALVKWALEAVGLDFAAVKGLSPFGLSGGEKRKAAIAGVLAMKPEILILDEPTAGLDPSGRRDFMYFLARLNREGTTVLMVSHDADSLSECADRILILDHGKLILDSCVGKTFSDVEMMKALHLSVSQPRETAYLLQKRGITFRQDIIRYEELFEELMGRLKGRGADE